MKLDNEHMMSVEVNLLCFTKSKHCDDVNTPTIYPQEKSLKKQECDICLQTVRLVDMDGTASHGVLTVRTGASAIHGLVLASVLRGTLVQRVKVVSL